MKLKYLPLLIISSLAMLCGCGDDSSNSASGQESVDSSSSVVSEPASSGSLVDGGPSTEAVYAVDVDGFATVAEVYKKLGPNDRVVFVLRHAERESGLGFESPLTEVGVQQSVDLGKELVSDEQFFYASSGFVRTTNTCKNIAVGRGEGDVAVEVLENLGGNWFVAVEDLESKAKSKGGTPTVVAKWVYSDFMQEWFYELGPRAQQFIDEVIVAGLPSWKRVNIFVTHDLLVMPLVAFVSNKTIDMQIHKTMRWLNFLAGVAVIVDGAGKVSLVPVKGTKSGIQGKGATIQE